MILYPILNLCGVILKKIRLLRHLLKKLYNIFAKTLDWNKLIDWNYSYYNLIRFCVNSIIRYPTIGSILDLYTNDEESKKFIENVQYNINKIQEIKSIVKSEVLPYITSNGMS